MVRFFSHYFNFRYHPNSIHLMLRIKTTIRAKSRLRSYLCLSNMCKNRNLLPSPLRLSFEKAFICFELVYEVAGFLVVFSHTLCLAHALPHRVFPHLCVRCPLLVPFCPQYSSFSFHVTYIVNHPSHPASLIPLQIRSWDCI